MALKKNSELLSSFQGESLGLLVRFVALLINCVMVKRN